MPTIAGFTVSKQYLAAQLGVCAVSAAVLAFDAAVPAPKSMPWWRLDLRVVDAERSWADDRAFHAAKQAGTPDAFRQYVGDWPAGQHRTEASETLDDIAFAEAGRKADPVDAYQQYFRDYPDGRHAIEARRLLASEVQRRRAAEQDSRDWSAAQKADTPSGYRGYLTDHPDGRFADKARSMIPVLEVRGFRESLRQIYAGAKDAPAKESLEAVMLAFLTQPSDPRLRQQVQQIRSELVWPGIAAANSAKRYHQFVADFPDSTLVSDALNRLKIIQSTAVPLGKDCADCPDLMSIPEGSFWMGNMFEGGEDERPQHMVRLDGFAVSRQEVTFTQWDACVAAGGCQGYRPADGGWGRGNRPVINVSWDDANEYVAWLTRTTNRPYRLLTEAEWEYAARARTTASFAVPTGSRDWARYNWANTSWGRISKPSDNDRRTNTVGQYAANGFGLYDMNGNVAEWVQDCYRPSYVQAPMDGSAVGGGTGPGCGTRVVRGGSWDDPPDRLRSSARASSPAFARRNTIGFRVARSID
jgi:formylglycine-generating enzyme required for sulfatase activity